MENLFRIEVEKFSKELQLLLILMQAKGHPSQELLKEINWNNFYTLSLHHRVFPIIYLKLKHLSEDHVPLYIIQTLSVEYKKNLFRMLHLSRETEEIAKLFANNKIPTLFLKGTVLAVDLYGDISLRTSADIDILIPFDQLNSAEDILHKRGFKKDEYIQTVLNDWKWRHHHFTFFHPDKKIKVEIHWRLNPGPAKEPSFEELWKRRKVSNITNYPIYTLGQEDLFLFLICHGARHGWSRLRWLEDINQIVKLRPDWTLVIKLLKEYQYQHLAGQTLTLLDNLFEIKIPSEFQRILIRKRTKQLALDALFYIKQMINLHTEPVPKEVSQYHKKFLFSLMSTRQKFFFILSFLYPYPEDAEFFPLPSKLHFLYFPLRPMLLVLRRTKNCIAARRG